MSSIAMNDQANSLALWPPGSLRGRAWLLLLLLCLLLLCCGSCRATTSRTTVRMINGQAQAGPYVSAFAYEHYLRSQIALQRGQVGEAIGQLELALAFDPDAPYLHVRLAELYAQRKDSQQSWTHLQQALAHRPDFADALLLAGRLHWQEGKKEQGARYFRRCIEKNPQVQECALEFAELLEQDQQPQLARKILHALIERLPKTASQGHQRIAILCLRQVDYPCAARHLQRIPSDQQSLTTMLQLAHVHRAMGRLEQASSLLHRAFDHSAGDPGIAALLLETMDLQGRTQEIDDVLTVLEHSLDGGVDRNETLAQLMLESGRPMRLLQLLDQSDPQKRSPALQVISAQALAKLGRVQEALAQLREHQQQSQDGIFALALAQLLIKMDDLVGAAATLEKSQQTQPVTIDLVLLHSRVLYLMGQLQASVQVVRDALSIKKDDPTLRFALGLALERSGQWSAALPIMQQLLAQEPDDAKVLNFIGYALLLHGGDRRQAERYIRRALFLQPGEGFIIDSLGWLLFKQSRLTEAKQILTIAVRLLPRDAEIIAHLAEVYAVLGEGREAHRLLQQAIPLSEDKKVRARLKAQLAALRKGLLKSP